MFEWNLEKPLAVFDIEATGTSPGADRIVELAIVRINTDGTRSTYVQRINPGIPIPAEVTDIHGITDADVAECPTFPQIVADVENFLEACDLAGYNLIRYDIPMLEEEYRRAGKTLDLTGRRVVDVQRIFHRKEPRDLTAALKYYCQADLVGAHGALADTEATLNILEAQLERYEDLPRDMTQLDAYCNPRNRSWVDRNGRLKWANGEVVLNFGKRKGTRLRDLVNNETSFIKWILRSDFPRDTKIIVENAVEGRWPDPPKKKG